LELYLRKQICGDNPWLCGDRVYASTTHCVLTNETVITSSALLFALFALVVGLGIGFAFRFFSAAGSQVWPRSLALGAVVVVLLAGLACTIGGAEHVQANVAPFAKSTAAANCAAIAADLQVTSSRWAVASWLSGILAALLAVIGGILGQGADPEAPWYRRGAGVLLATLGTALASTSAFSVSRSAAAGDAAAEATLALGSRDPYELYGLCLAAKAEWLRSRAESLDQTPPPSNNKAASGQQGRPPNASSSNELEATAPPAATPSSPGVSSLGSSNGNALSPVATGSLPPKASN
jgi:hypothetical protein